MRVFFVRAADFSVFVGDLAPDVTDYALQEHFRQFFASVRSAKVACCFSHVQSSSALPLQASCCPFRTGSSASSIIRPSCLLFCMPVVHALISYIDAVYLQVITDPLTGRSKGYGFVRFGNEAERDRSLTEMSGHVINSRPIRVSIATAKKSQTAALVSIFCFEYIISRSMLCDLM